MTFNVNTTTKIKFNNLKYIAKEFKTILQNFKTFA